MAAPWEAEKLLILSHKINFDRATTWSLPEEIIICIFTPAYVLSRCPLLFEVHSLTSHGSLRKHKHTTIRNLRQSEVSGELLSARVSTICTTIKEPIGPSLIRSYCHSGVRRLLPEPRYRLSRVVLDPSSQFSPQKKKV